MNFPITIDRNASTPAYQQLCDQIAELIRGDQIHIGELLPPENLLCERSGLSRMTVRRAMENLNRMGLICAEKGRGTFVIAKEPSTNHHSSIGFALRPDRYIEEDPFYSQILLGVTHQAQKLSLHLAFLSGDHAGDHDYFSRQYPILTRLSGLIVAGQMPDTFLDYLQKIRIPCVLLNYRSSKHPYDAVTTDQREVGKILARHLVELGHTHCLYLRGEPENTAFEERLAGFREVFVYEHGRKIEVLPGGKSTQTGRELIQEAWRKQIPFTAVAAGNDLLAIGAMNELQDGGFRVPEDVSVCGVDNVSATESCRPSLTTIHIEKQEMGFRAIQLLLDRMNNPKKVQETILLGVQLMKRQSTGIVSP